MDSFEQLIEQLQDPKKRKADESMTNIHKKMKSEESHLPIGSQVAAKLTQEWILANVLNYITEKQKYEVEDAEDDGH